METLAAGTPATLVLPQDRYPYVVKAVSPSGNKVTLDELELPHLEADYTHNGFPVFDHVFTQTEIDAARRLNRIYAYRQKNGLYYNNGCLVSFGRARYHRDYSD